MAQHVSGIAITIKAFLPTGKTLDEQFTALSLVKDAHANGDYSAVLKAAKIDEVKAEQKTRRVEDTPATTETGKTEEGGDTSSDSNAESKEPAGTVGGAQMEGDDDNAEQSDEAVPSFLKNSKKKSA